VNSEQNNRSSRTANSGTSGRTDEVKETLESVKQKANATLSQAGETVSGVVSDALSEAKSTASEVVSQASQEAQGAVDQQKGRAAERIESVAGALRQTGAQLDAQEHTAFARYTDAAAEQLERFSEFLNNRNAADLLQEVDRFARRQPELFVAGALAGGFLLGRFLKSTSERNRYQGRYYDQPSGQYGSQYGGQYSSQGRSGYSGSQYSSDSGDTSGYGQGYGNPGGQGREGWLSQQGDTPPRANHGAVEDPQPSSGQVTATYPAGERFVAQQTYESFEGEDRSGEGALSTGESGFHQEPTQADNMKAGKGNDEGKQSPGSAHRDPYQDPGPR
jgi:vacuolar-type H+-ATPase subunit H